MVLENGAERPDSSSVRLVKATRSDEVSPPGNQRDYNVRCMLFEVIGPH